MLRTKDFVLFVVVVIFLFVGIGTTTVVKFGFGGFGEDKIKLSESVSVTEYTVELLTKEELSREGRLALMRQKVAESGDFSISESSNNGREEIVESENVTSPISTAEEIGETENIKQPVDNKPIRCVSYSNYHGQWSMTGVSLVVSEGARLVYATPEVLLVQLPIRSFPSVTPSCLSSDVIGIATDGSLIRNNEVGLYGIFGSETLIGYALDGFPIYGKKEIKTDACGGVVEGEQYRYYLSGERDILLNCFAAPPGDIP
jgi:hypothetical protein